MAEGDTITKKSKETMLHRMYTENASLSSTQYLPPTRFKVGVSNQTPNIEDTDLLNAIPISDGTINDDGSNNFTGSSGGDNSTNNTTIFKQGANASDDTAQNLIANTSNATKQWTLSSLDNNVVSSQYLSQFLYIADSDILAKFLSSGTCLELRYGSDASNYYSKTYEASDLSTGWNLLMTGLVSDLTATGSPGTLSRFDIIVTTNNATDTFSTDELVYDLLRQWESIDLYKDFAVGYPEIDDVNLSVKLRCYLTTLEANGYLIDSVATFNEDTVPLMFDESTITGESKSDTDEFAFVIVNWAN